MNQSNKCGASPSSATAREGSVTYYLSEQMSTIALLSSSVEHIEQATSDVQISRMVEACTNTAKSEQATQPQRCAVAHLIAQNNAQISNLADRLRDLALRIGIS